MEVDLLGPNIFIVITKFKLMARSLEASNIQDQLGIQMQPIFAKESTGLDGPHEPNI